MQVTIEIPDELALRLIPAGADPRRTALESIAIEGYRSGSLTSAQARRLLGFETRYEFDGFLKAHNIWEHAYELEDLVHDRESIALIESRSA